MKSRLLTLTGILTFLAIPFYSCSDGDVEVGGDCPQKKWIGHVFTPTTILEVVPKDRQMSIQGENISGKIVDVFQPYITGNFEVVAEFEKLYETGASPTTAIPYVEMYIKNYSQPDSVLDPTSVYCRVSPYGLATVIGGTVTTHAFNLPYPTEYNGSIRVGRMNGKLIAKAIVGTDTLNTVVPATLSTTTQQVGIRFGAEVVTAGSVVTTAGVKLNKFNVVSANDGTNLLSDEFLCKSITFELP